MALNKRVYDDMPHVRRTRDKQDPQPHPYKAQSPHEGWCIDGRMMDCKLNGGKWWSIVILEGYSRTRLAAAVTPAGSQLGGDAGALDRLSTVWRPAADAFRPRRGVCLSPHFWEVVFAWQDQSGEIFR